MGASVVIKAVDVSAKRSPRLGNAGIGPQVDLLVFDAPPEPLRESSVPPSPFAIHADRDLGTFQQLREGQARELRSLIRVEDLGLAVYCRRLLDRKAFQFHPALHHPTTRERVFQARLQKIIRERKLRYLRVTFFYINRWRLFRLAFAENPSSPFKKLISPRLDHIRVDIELGGKLCQRLLTFRSSNRPLSP